MKIATAIRAALAESKTPLGAPPAAASSPPAIDLDTAKLDETIGVKGQANGGVYQFTVPRRDPVTEMGMALPPGPTGVAIAINFQPTGGGKAAITGDFVLTGEEVNPVIRAFRANGIDVTAIHSHMLDEQPRLFFVHFWANDDALKLAKGLREAIDKTATQRTEPDNRIRETLHDDNDHSANRARSASLCLLPAPWPPRLWRTGGAGRPNGAGTRRRPRLAD